VTDPTVLLRLRLIEHRVEMLNDVLEQDRIVARELAELSEAGFAHFNGTAPIPASSAEGDGEPVRHRLCRGGNRRLDAAIHRVDVTQLRYQPRAREIYDNARTNGHTRREAICVLMRNSSQIAKMADPSARDT
jgi:hypothetical protein